MRLIVPLVRFLRTAALWLGLMIGVQSVPAVAMQDDGAGEGGTGASADQFAESVAVEKVVDDKKIQQRLRSILDGLDQYGQVELEVADGVVQLSGSVPTSEAVESVKSLARRTEGVVFVDNNLQINGSVDYEETANVVVTSLRNLWRDFLNRLPLITAGLLALIATAVLAKIVSKVLQRVIDKRTIRYSLKDLIYQISNLLIWLAGLLVAAVIVFPGMTPSKALTVLGLGSVAIGFAFKDIFENFFAGVLILWKYPFDRGDFVQCGDLSGCVEEITIRNTLIRRLDGELAVVPNAVLFKETVDVLTNEKERRVRLICGVAYDEDVDQSREVIQKAVRQCVSVQEDRLVEVFACEFAASSVNFEVAWWTGSRPVDIRKSRDEVIAAIKTALDEAGIEIPFPYRTLTFKQPVPIERE